MPRGTQKAMADELTPGLEARVAKVEAHVEHLRESVTGFRGDFKDLRGDLKDLRHDVVTLKVDVATVKENVRHLPTKGFIVTVVGIALVFLAGLAAFAPKLQQWAGTAPAEPVAAPTTPLPPSAPAQR